MLLPNRYPHLFNISLIFILWLVMVLLASPYGEFPMNDDWAYCKSVYNLSEQGILKIEDLPAMSLVTQILWGAIFTKAFGFSFIILRISTLLLSITGLIATYFLVIESTRNKRLALFATLTLLANVMFFSLSVTFMTDVPFYALAVLAMLFNFRALRTGTILPIVIAAIFSIGATLLRQPGVLIPLSFSVVWMIQGKSARNVLFALLPLVITFAALVAYTGWMDATGRLPSTYAHASSIRENIRPAALALNVFHRGGSMVLYCGLFLLPLILLFVPKIPKSIPQSKIIAAAVVAVVFLVPLIRAWAGFPVGNIINLVSIGPITMKATYMKGIPLDQLLPDWAWHIVRTAGVIGGAALVFYISLYILTIRIRELDGAWAGAFGFVLLYGGFLIVCNSYFDRYFLPLLPALFIIISPFMKDAVSRVRTGFSAALISAMAVFAVTGSHDYFAWNRARWKALDFLMNEKNISPHDIDGGFEFNGWYATGPMNHENTGKSWWYVDNDEWVVTLGVPSGYEEIKRFPCEGAVFMKENIVVSRRK